MAEKKKGDYRVTVEVEITENYAMYKVGQIAEMHPVLSKRLIAQGVAKKSSNKKSQQN